MSGGRGREREKRKELEGREKDEGWREGGRREMGRKAENEGRRKLVRALGISSHGKWYCFLSMNEGHKLTRSSSSA